ncbi:MAG: GTPase Era [Acidobacteriota bacterium]|nr:GTPase Era [Acidobacteriota bacterium]
MSTHAGIVALAGRPNTGKSTLLNALAGVKVAAVSDRPQTTRRAIRGIWSSGDRQIVFVDLPGVQRPRDLLTSRMARRVSRELEGADAVLMLLAADERIGAGDRFIARTLQDAGRPVVVALNKVDRLKAPRVAAALHAADQLGIGEAIFPISARTGAGVAALLEDLGSRMPEGPFMFGRNAHSDQPLALTLAELIREAVVRRTFQELPHATEVIVEEIERTSSGLTTVRALIWVDSDSQKGIVIGAQGRKIKSIGSAARRDLERELATPVHLDLTVRTRRGWREDDALLDRLGIT